ncbi:MAG: opine dehydrogenase [Actinomycetia bacterium]|nr:opine dehydrogenase [Actinomycetes bacterium]
MASSSIDTGWSVAWSTRTPSLGSYLPEEYGRWSTGSGNRPAIIEGLGDHWKGDESLKVAVLGAGAGGTATAFDHAQHGHDVALFDLPQFAENLRAIAGQGGIHAEGALEGFASVANVGHDVGETLEGAGLIYVVGPAYSTAVFGQCLAGKLTAGQTVVVSPGSSGGALAFKGAAGLAIDDTSIRVAETSTLPYAVRLVAPGRVRVFLKLRGGMLLAALPSSGTSEILQLVADVYPHLEAGTNVMQTSLQNANPVIHPAVTLTNTARIDGSDDDFLFYEEGVSDATGRLIQALDEERIAIGVALGMSVVPDPAMGVRQGYMLDENYGSGYRTAPGFLGILAQPSLDHRYLNEDVGYGLVFWSRLAAQIGVDTPVIDAVILLASRVMDRDYAGEALRTPELLGIGGRSAAELAHL